VRAIVKLLSPSPCILKIKQRKWFSASPLHIISQPAIDSIPMIIPPVTSNCKP
jgi:hypothetical protein